MNEPVHLIAFALGLLIIFVTWSSVISTIILPRVSGSRITYRSWLVVRASFIALIKHLRRYDRADALLAYLGPVSMLATLASWLMLFFLGFSLLFWPLLGGDLGRALALSGSSMFTLGVATSGLPGPVALEFLAAATGLVVVALQIGYLPTIYSAYNRREMLVTALSSRAGTPAWGPEILARHHLNQSTATLPALYSAWETWAADIMESHNSYPWLMVFRSPDALNSWVISLLAVMDSAALYLALAPTLAPAEGRQFLRMGYVALRSLVKLSGFTVNDDPHPDDPLKLPYGQFVAAVDHLRASGFAIERTAEEAWPDFRGWRVNYEEAAYTAADFLFAAPAPWSGPRSFLSREDTFDILAHRPRHRTPDDPEGLAALPATWVRPSRPEAG
jgi:hypothetical protein